MPTHLLVGTKRWVGIIRLQCRTVVCYAASLHCRHRPSLLLQAQQVEKWNLRGTERDGGSNESPLGLAGFWWRRKWNQGRVSAVYAKAHIYTFARKPARRAKLLLATLSRPVLQHLAVRPTDAAMPIGEKRKRDSSAEMTARDLLTLCFVEGKGWEVNVLYWSWIHGTESHNSNIANMLRLMFAVERSLNNKWCSVPHTTTAFTLRAW